MDEANQLRLAIAARALRDMREHPCLRWGQAIFNAAHEIRPDLAGPLAATDLDPFHVDSRVLMFLSAIEQAARCSDA